MNWYLTPAEQRVLLLVAKGYIREKIAEELHITPKTVESHKMHILKKMGVHNSPAMVARGFVTGYLRVGLGGDLILPRLEEASVHVSRARSIGRSGGKYVC